MQAKAIKLYLVLMVKGSNPCSIRLKLYETCVCVCMIGIGAHTQMYTCVHMRKHVCCVWVRVHVYSWVEGLVGECLLCVNVHAYARMCLCVCHVCAHMFKCVYMCALCSYVGAHAFILIFMDARGQHQVSLLTSPLYYFCITVFHRAWRAPVLH